tara:strand:- start:281 stop:1420 length:1140 start_codon:yes stop_codon:yes gene_type:complete
MKKIIYRNLAIDCTKFFLLTVFTISTIIWVLQAVNYLDFVVEDGHGFLVYFNYTLLSFPKIISRIFPFAIFLAFSYILLKYENKNELVIFWSAGINKINFINFFLKFSFFFVLLSLFLNTIVVPYSQDKARSFIRSSDLDFFESILKPKKFIDVIENLTIYFDKRNEKGELENVFINEKSTQKNESKTIFSKIGLVNNKGNTKILELFDGKTINFINGKTTEFKFSRTDFNISKFGSSTITHQKTQETSTYELLKCALIFKNSKNNSKNTEIKDIKNCWFVNLENVYEELYSRVIKPLYITFLITISLLFILKSKSDPTFRLNKYKIYSFSFLFIIFLESSSKLINTNMITNLLLIVLPMIFTLTIYIYFLINLRVKKK